MKEKMTSDHPDEYDIMESLEEIKTLISRKIPDSSGYYDSADIKQVFNLSDSTLYRMRKRKAIPCVRLGRKYYYPKKFFDRSVKR
ncbi:helix-turn-helix domain-containing protein [Sinomicrobium weinanense]|uniref:Helix-turn-helix domain-containing protein n=1 Tax=Sinomicrobium weinanense TaxID=2842200 RepID=A0A926JT98_9FLAO|nr:helix-turn-helix domain-containing protein [Sinomicrobium weinanense]MBC9796791.1 helix-turn-helix domain-containing protein [Sinomicrobium weinanense]MBU3125522.1 helix-turn-helix domain-containing protein [Sinomicrobium weinanense]